MPRILLVEDDPEVRLIIEEILLDAEHEVDAAQTIKGGLELLCCHDYDLVLSDGVLQDGTGMMIADKASKKGTPILIITGYAYNPKASGFFQPICCAWMKSRGICCACRMVAMSSLNICKFAAG